MEKIFSNQASHSVTCEFCGERMVERPFEVWANVPEHEPDLVDFAIADNRRMEDRARREWEEAADKFWLRHKDCRNKIQL